MYDLIASQMRQKDWSDWDVLIGGEVAFQDMLAPALLAALKSTKSSLSRRN